MTTTVRLRPGHGSAAEIIKPIGQIWTELARRYELPLVLLQQHPAPGPALICL
jgi:hypothetical protein